MSEVTIVQEEPFLFILFTYEEPSVYAVAQLVETPRYKPEGRGFNSRWNFSLT